MKHNSVDIFVVIALTLTAIALAFIVPPDNVAGRIWALPLVFLFPGYALTSALFTKQSPGIAECLAFSVGLSLSIVITGGLILNWTPFGLRANSWAVFLGVITLGASTVTLLRRRGQSSSTSEWIKIGHLGLTFRQGILLSAAAMIICGAVAISIIGAQRQPFPGFTQFWMLPAGRASTSNTVRLGVKNMEATAMDYRLVINMNNKVVKVWSAIAINQNGTWEATFMLPQVGHGSNAKVEAMLYRKNAPTKIYRFVILWLGT